MLSRGNSQPVAPCSVRLVHIVTIPLSLWAPLRGQIGFMRERGLEIHAITSPGEYLERFAAREGIPVHAVEMPRRITPHRDVIAVARIYRHLRRIRPHIVNAGTPKGGLLGMLSAWLARVPVRIYHMRGLPMETATGSRRWLLKLSEKVSCTLAQRVICVSHAMRETAIREGLCRPDKIMVPAAGSGNGIDTGERFNPDRLPLGTRHATRARFDIPIDALVIGFVGRVVRDKGVLELESAWRMLRDDFPSAHLLVAGWPESQDPIPADVAARLRADPRIRMTGGVDDMPGAYAAMDVLAVPTYREGLPNAPLEAGAMRLPVVASDISGCREAITDGVTGTIVPLYDAHALANALRAYLADPDLRARHGRAGRERVVREFRREVIWEIIYGQYEQLLRERGMPLLAPAGVDAVARQPHDIRA
jgi:glycosyltransferase involved in cell wall biosynthesis